MSLKGKLEDEIRYYTEKYEKVKEEISALEKKVSDEEAFLDTVLDEVELGENLLKKLKENPDGKDGRN